MIVTKEQVRLRTFDIDIAALKAKVDKLEGRRVIESRDVYVLLLETALESMGRADCVAMAKVAVGVMES